LLLSGHTHGGQICLPGSIPSHSIPCCRDDGSWRMALPRHVGYTYRGRRDRASLPYDSIVHRRSRCIGCVSPAT
jgi:hypothetical protein